jgi:uncharacterized protein YdhG (YjbR/CyaY superfamily)
MPAMNTKPTDVDAYLAALPDNSRAALEGLRRAIKASAPNAVESISYAMPTYKYRGKPLTYFAAARNHCALYGLSAVLKAHGPELAAYDTSKGTIRFPPARPIPEALLRTLLKARMEEIDAAEAESKRKKTKLAGQEEPGTANQT